MQWKSCPTSVYLIGKNNTDKIFYQTLKLAYGHFCQAMKNIMLPYRGTWNGDFGGESLVWNNIVQNILIQRIRIWTVASRFGGSVLIYMFINPKTGGTISYLPDKFKQLKMSKINGWRITTFVKKHVKNNDSLW